MTKKIFRSIFIVAIAVLLACLVLIFGALYGYFGTLQENQLKTELMFAAEAIEDSGIAYLDKLDMDTSRLTWIAADGSVLFDSEGRAESMENHGEREEIREAFEKGTGESSRFSSTLTEETLYYAQRLSDGTVLRISVSRMTVLALFIGMLQPIFIVLAVAMVLSAVLAHRMAERIVEPFNRLDLDKPLENDVYDELSPMLTHIEQQRRQICRQKVELQERKSEFYAVIRNMSEGLVLLSEKDRILSINPAAASFLGADADCEGRDFLSVERSHEIDKALSLAKSQGHSELMISRNGREYQLNLNNIKKDERILGIVILIFDITERAFAERNRREFTANVSHELKTPLQAIMGSAELIENGLVQPEDMPRFVGRIRAEAARLVALIEDIIRLSQLDEGGELSLEAVDLYEIAGEELEALLPVAADRNITLSLEGHPAVVKGTRRLLREVMFNLCDNAIKYNVDGGSVKVTVKSDDGSVRLSVEDTGIGIPQEHHARVFERFYRVDKSHSRETGGTGLGLSIVKHAVQYMNGRIELHSSPGNGTVIQVFFLPF